jgi:hypothetical protein
VVRPGDPIAAITDGLAADRRRRARHGSGTGPELRSTLIRIRTGLIALSARVRAGGARSIGGLGRERERQIAGLPGELDRSRGGRLEERGTRVQLGAKLTAYRRLEPVAREHAERQRFPERQGFPERLGLAGEVTR